MRGRFLDTSTFRVPGRVAVAMGIAGAVSITAALALTVLAASTCSGSYQCPPVSAPPGAFPTAIVSGTASSTSDTTISGSAAGSTYMLLVPKGALPNGTTVDILQGNPSVLASFLPSGQGYVDSAAVGWQAPDGSTPVAGSALVLTVTNQQVTSGDSMYQTVTSGLQPASGASASPHQWSASFTTDPGFVVAGRGVTTPTAGAPLSGTLPLAAVLLAIGITLLAARRRLTRRARH